MPNFHSHSTSIIFLRYVKHVTTPRYSRKTRKVLRRKNIKRRTGARAQSKQIAALSSQVSKLTHRQFEPVMLGWQRPTANIDLVAGGTNAYVLPIPITPNNPTSQINGVMSGTDAPLRWSDNRGMSSANYFTKSPMFGISASARSSPEWIHTGSTLKYRLQTNEPSFSTYSVFLVQARSRQADQLISDRRLKNQTTGSYPGSASTFNEGSDFITHQDVMGTMFNKKYWKVLYHRDINFSVPGVTAVKTTNVDLKGGADTRDNTVLKEGSCRIPAGGSIKCFNTMPYKNPSSPALGREAPNAIQLGYLDEDTSKTCYFVIVNNGVSADMESCSLSTLVLDRYKAVV